MQYFDVFERTEQTEHKPANEIYLLASDAMFILCAYLIFTTLERCIFFMTSAHSIMWIIHR